MEKTSKWRRWTLRLGLALPAVGLIVLVGLDAWATRQLAHEIQRAQALGSLELETYVPRLGRGEANATHVLSAASHLLLAAPFERDTPAWNDVSLDQAGLDPELVERARAWIGRPRHELALGALDLHASTRACRVTYGKPAELPHIAHSFSNQRGIAVLRTAKLLRSRAWVSSADGDTEAAYRDAAMMLRMSNWVHTELPSLFSWLIGNAVAKMGTQVMEELHQVAPPSAEARGLLRQELELLQKRGPSWGLEAERALSHEKMLQGYLWGTIDRGGSLFSQLRLAFTSWQEKAFHAKWLAVHNELVRQARLPVYERPGVDALYIDDSPYAIPAKMLVPNITHALDKADELAMDYRLALLALAWEQERDSEGAYPVDPRTLDAPPDLFTGRALTWRREADRWIVYSVGVNQQDEDGVDEATPQSGDADDVGWRLPVA